MRPLIRAAGALEAALVLAGFAASCAVMAVTAGYAQAQALESLTLQEAVRRALASHPNAALAAVDSVAAAQRLAAARLLPDPALVTTWTRDLPHYHAEAEGILDVPWIRSPRIEAATWSARAVWAGADLARATLTHDVIVAYERAVAARMLAQLSDRMAADADQILATVTSREQAGDAAQLDVLLADLDAGRARTERLTDSLAAVDAVLELQALLLLPADRLSVEPADPLAQPVPVSFAALPARPLEGAVAPSPLSVVVAEAEARAAQSRLLGARRGRIPAPGLIAGVETGAGPDEPQFLPLVGLSVTLPIFSRGRTEVDAARSESMAAALRVELARNAVAVERTRAARTAETARARAELDARLVANAERVAQLTLVGLQEGALPLVQVLEARRLAIDANRSLVDQLLTARVAEADLFLASAVGGLP